MLFFKTEGSRNTLESGNASLYKGEVASEQTCFFFAASNQLAHRDFIYEFQDFY